MQRELRLTRRTMLATLCAGSAAATAGCGVLSNDSEDGNGNGEADEDGGTDPTEEAPSVLVETRQATTVGSRSGVLNGELDDPGEYGTIDCYFQYRESGGDWTETQREPLSSPGDFSRKLSELSPETEYEFRAVGDAGGADVRGETKTFATRPDPTTAQITTGSLTLSFEDDGTDRTPVAEVPVTNEGGDASGAITLDVTWYDADRTELGTSTTTLETLGAGETWLAQITPRNLDEGTVASVTADTTIEQDPPQSPEGVRLDRSELRAGEYPPEVTGAVENTGEQPVAVEPIARVFDAEGRVIADSRSSTREIPAGGRRSFVASFVDRQAERIQDGFDHEVVLDGQGE